LIAAAWDRQEGSIVLFRGLSLAFVKGAAMAEFRKKAEECLRAAEKMHDQAERIAMIRTACDYMNLADEAADVDCAHKGKSSRSDK
jgi:hypothetical protein